MRGLTRLIRLRIFTNDWNVDSLDACDAVALETRATCLECAVAAGGVTSTVGGISLAVGGVALTVDAINLAEGGVTLGVCEETTRPPSSFTAS